MNLQRPHEPASPSWDWQASLNAGRLASKLGGSERAIGRFHEALKLAETAGDMVGVRESLNAIGVALSEQGRPQDAAEAFRRVIRSASEDPAGSDAATIAKINLGEVLTRLGKTVEAEAVLREAAAKLDPFVLPLEWATSMNNLGILLAEQGREQEATHAFVAALDRARATLGPDHPRTIMLLANLGASLRRNGDEAGGLTVLREALALAEEALGSDFPETRLLRAELAGA